MDYTYYILNDKVDKARLCLYVNDCSTILESVWKRKCYVLDLVIP